MGHASPHVNHRGHLGTQGDHVLVFRRLVPEFSVCTQADVGPDDGVTVLSKPVKLLLIIEEEDIMADARHHGHIMREQSYPHDLNYAYPLHASHDIGAPRDPLIYLLVTGVKVRRGLHL